MATALIRLPKVLELTGLSRSEIYRRMALGQFPQKVPLGLRAVAWDKREVSAWIKDRISMGRKPDAAGGETARPTL